MFMKTFEEKWTAWLDEELSEKERLEFEASLPDKAAAEDEKRDARKVGTLLKEQLGAHALSNADFFSHQLRQRIAREMKPALGGQPHSRSSWWTIPRLFWSGAAAMALFFICAVFVIREKNPPDQSQYLTQILQARVDPVVSPNATISMFESKEDKVTVLWVDGLQSLPSEYAAK
jgi:anti-sigma factor RsiW